MKALLIAGTVMIALLWVAFIGVAVAAIWTTGVLSSRLGNTAVLMVIVGLIASILCAGAWSES